MFQSTPGPKPGRSLLGSGKAWALTGFNPLPGRNPGEAAGTVSRQTRNQLVSIHSRAETREKHQFRKPR